MHPGTCTELCGQIFSRFGGISIHFGQNIAKSMISVGPWARGPWAQGPWDPGTQGTLGPWDPGTLGA